MITKSPPPPRPPILDRLKTFQRAIDSGRTARFILKPDDIDEAVSAIESRDAKIVQLEELRQ